MFGQKKENPPPEVKKDTLQEEKKPVNIFSELSGELDFGKIEHEEVEVNKKDKIYYLTLTGNIFVFLNIGLFLFVLVGLSFVKVQNNSDYYDKDFLNPFCMFLLGSEFKDKNTASNCSSVAALIENYKANTASGKVNIVSQVTPLMKEIYNFEKFTNSKEMTFLMENKSNRLRVLDILHDFDNLKNEFSGGDKSMIVCEALNISKDSVVSTSCTVKTSSWDTVIEGKGIIGYNGLSSSESSRIDGSSITLGASFLNFIEKNPQFHFQLQNKQKTFSSSFISDGRYVKTTTIPLQLQYDAVSKNLSL